MILFFRLIWTFLFSRFRTPCPVVGPCLTPFRCLPTDLDVLRHMNNGIYFSILDLARVDLMTRAGIASKLSRNGFYPVVVAETIRFKKSISPFESFFVETTVIGWDDKAFLLQQKFLKKNECVAEAVIRARFLKKTGGSVNPSQVLEIAEYNLASPALPTWIKAWNNQQKVN